MKNSSPHNPKHTQDVHKTHTTTAPHTPTAAEELLHTLTETNPDSTCTHSRTLPATPATYAPWPNWAHQPLVDKLSAQGITSPYSHQALTADLAWNGNHVVIATGTSSGKSLCYLLPTLTALATNPTATALYLTPTKALGNDQLLNTSRLIHNVDGLSTIHPAPYDGDTPTDARSTIREQSRFIFTNPDMLHAGILRNHTHWQRLLRNLNYIIIDECHSYRGVFGAHVALVLRRLIRLARRYKANPRIILASATTANPAAHASTLIGADVSAVTTDGSPHGSRTIGLWQPALLSDTTGENGAPIRRAPTTEAASIMATLITEGARTLTFVRSRTQAELTALACQEQLSSHHRADLASRVASYRAGYLPEHRRQLEQALDNGELIGLASTNALELGIDVGGLDAVICAGYPGTIASFWQQIGRAGRRGQSSLALLIGRDEPLDNYLLHHPEALLDTPIEQSVFNPHNPTILAGHLYCAALETPLNEADIATFNAEKTLHSLIEAGFLRRRANGWYAQLKPGLDGHERLNLRGSGHQIRIVDSTDGRLLGTIDATQAHSHIHPGAVYVHQGEHFVVDELDLDGRLALVHPEAPDYYTVARSTTDIRIVDDPVQVSNPAPGLWISNVDVEVTTQVVGYMVKGFDGSIINQVPLDLPPNVLLTRSVAYTIDPTIFTALGIEDIPGALHAAEHAAIGLLPLIATCDRWDIGGVSTALHPDTLLPTVFVYDGYPGGAGFADEGYRRFAEWIGRTYDTIDSCECDSGCPRCVQSPKCGNGNNPLDKQGAHTLLGAMVSMLAGKD
ncbi:putative ATP-dependent helicase Lhr [Corynebacterium felinum]|uniref:DEAD/DEAH box helicase n=1 Tax=Corynebacterium felinum TaxID=131318 RepID=UPI00286ABA0A|nr:DEAD/DEAH box helicase [Corynebacterium felinum]WJY96263.1 putative ATP-dependent helicase Lhr [Corynebacterium felinum]